MNITHVRKIPSLASVIGAGLFFALFISTPFASASGFVPGDLLVALTNGTVQVRSAADGTLKDTLTSGIQAPAKGLAFDSAGNLLVSYWWTPDLSGGNTLVKFHPDGTFAGTFGSHYYCQPSGIAVDKDGNVYAGEGQCGGNILKFDSAGNLTTVFAPAIENGGARWIDLAPDGCTMYYTSAGVYVERYNVCTDTQLSNVNSTPLTTASGAAALGLRLMPDGGVMVGAAYDIRRLDASGNVVDIYSAAGDYGLAAVWLDKNGTSFWSSSYATGTVYKFDIASHAMLMNFSIGVSGTGAKGVIIVPPRPTTVPPPPPPPPVPGRMTGGGTFAASDGTIVSHGFQLRCNVRDPRQNLEINWGKGQKFHLETVTSVTCSDDPAINPGDPAAPFDTMVLTGTGKFGGKDGATISLTFSDAGEPGSNDGIQMVIKDSRGTTVLNVPATKLISGNQQAHRATGKQF